MSERINRLAANGGWIGVDLDGTLAQYDGWKGPWHIGPPVPKMLERVQAWRAAGIEVRIMTARAHPNLPQEYRDAVRLWMVEHLGQEIRMTVEKDLQMIELWDDRAVQVRPNTGERVDGEP